MAKLQQIFFHQQVLQIHLLMLYASYCGHCSISFNLLNAYLANIHTIYLHFSKFFIANFKICTILITQFLNGITLNNLHLSISFFSSISPTSITSSLLILLTNVFILIVYIIIIALIFTVVITCRNAAWCFNTIQQRLIFGLFTFHQAFIFLI